MINNDSFLGTGWAFPPTFKNNGASIDMVSDEEDIRQSMEILLSTGLGERLMHPDFGCDLGGFLFEEIDQSLITGIKGIIFDTFLEHETRIDLANVDISEDKAISGLLLIKIDYKIRSTNSRHNMVYPFYITEAAGMI